MEITDYLPERYRKMLSKLPPESMEALQEIRFRAEQPLCLRLRGGFFYLTREGTLSRQAAQAVKVRREEMAALLTVLSQSSLYAFDEELRRGYITLPGGHRAGLCGHAILENGRLKGQRDISSVDIRIARAVPGCAERLLGLMMQGRTLPPHTLIISPPGCGKTTLLRDMAAALSDRYALQVGIVDERSEIAACAGGRPQLWVGANTDVLDACPKAEGMMLMLRSMSPQVLICDEIGRREDMEAICEAVNAGVRVIASAHAASRRELLARPAAGELLRQRSFEMLALYSARQGPGMLEQVWDAEGHVLY